jgi:hypothetical protein
MLVAIIVEHFIHVESNPPPGRVVHECRYCTPGCPLTVRSHEDGDSDCMTAASFMTLATSAPSNRHILVRADGVELVI